MGTKKTKGKGAATSASPRKSKKKSAATASPAPITGPTPPMGSEDAYNQHLAAAAALGPKSVIPFRQVASLIYANAAKGVASVMARKAEIAAKLPGEDIAALVDVEQIALGLLFAAIQARPRGTRNDTFHQNLAQARALRKLMLSSATAAADAGILDPKEIAFAKKGRGPTDSANDLIQLSALFKANAAKLAGRTAITPAQIAQAAALGTALAQSVTPAGVKKDRRGVSPQAIDTRDRFWTLLLSGYDRVERVGAYLFGLADLATFVPTLRSHVVRGSAAKKAKTAQTAATKAAEKAKKAAARAATVKTKAPKKAKKAKAAGATSSAGATNSAGQTTSVPMPTRIQP